MNTKLHTLVLWFALTLLPLNSFGHEVAAVAPSLSGATQDLDGVINQCLNKVLSKIEGTKGRVAVMDFPSLDGRQTGLSSYINNKAGNRLIEAGRQVVDRVTLEKVISEQKLQQNSLIDAATAAKVGKLTGAAVFIIGNYTHLASKFVLTVRALSVETGQFIPGAVSEQTVKPVPVELQQEINELAGVTGLKATTPNLDAPSSDSAIAPPSATEEQKEEIAFYKAVCEVIDPNMDMGKIVKLAHEHHVMPSYKEDGYLKGKAYCPDSLGEAHTNTCYYFPGFTFGVHNFALSFDTDRIARAIKGKQIDIRLERWAYNGPDFPGVNQCAPNGSEWNDKRGKAKK